MEHPNITFTPNIQSKEQARKVVLGSGLITNK